MPRLRLPVLARVLAHRRQLAASWRQYEGRRLAGELFFVFLGHAVRCLQLEGRQDALTLSLLPLRGKVLTAAQVDEYSLRLAGRLPELRRGQAVYRWARQQTREWALVRVLAAAWEQRKGRAGGRLQLLVLSGTAAAERLTLWWSWRLLRASARVLGYPRLGGGRVPRYACRDPGDLVNFRFAVLLDPLYSGEQAGFRELACAGAQREFNQELIRRRARIDPGYDCPQGYPRDWACHHCPVGYQRCPAATHRHDYVQALCLVCHRQGWFDPGATPPATCCLECQHRKDPPLAANASPAPADAGTGPS